MKTCVDVLDFVGRVLAAVVVWAVFLGVVAVLAGCGGVPEAGDVSGRLHYRLGESAIDCNAEQNHDLEECRGSQ